LVSGSVTISPEMQRLLGVQVSPVERVSATHVLRLFGRVAPDEGRVYRLNAGIDGFVGEVSAATTGSQVKKDQLLATFAAPDAIAAIQAYILALNAVDRLKQGGGDISTQIDSVTGNPTNSNYQQRLEKLQNLGMSVLQVEEIRRTRQVPPSIKMLAPVDGFVLARNISPGQKFDRGAEFYRVADLSRVWILADVSQHEARYLRPGVHAKVRLPDEPKPLAATVAEILPQFDAATRTLKVRLEADNAGYILRPDMFVDVELPINLPTAIALPVDAILDSGLKKTVFVDLGEGLFEPRQVETGWRFGGRVEIVTGLRAGERIVTAGTFLLDSESRMKLAAARISGTSSTGEPAQPGHEHAAHQHASHQK
jgi:membrane fusion protein, copper/silver efflux system